MSSPELPLKDPPLSARLTRRSFLKQTGLAAGSLLVSDLFAGGWVAAAQEEPPPLALINLTLIDGTGAPPVPDAAVVIHQGRIQDAGPRGQVEIPQGVARLDMGGGTLLPGFINAHVHGGYRADVLTGWARGGVTTVRDLGALGIYSANLFKIRDTLCANPRCAQLVAVGSFINVTGGYPIAYWNGFAVTVDTPADAEREVNRLVDDGAEVIKTAFESGYTFAQSGWPLLPPATAKALVAAAHQRGVPVTAHVTSARDLPLALDAGVDEIAHMVVDPCPDELIQRTAAAGVRWVPTLELWQGVSRRHNIHYDQVAVENLARFVQAGGEVALGTDYAGAPVPFELGMPLAEIRLMAAAGMTPAQILVAGTRNAARACNLAQTLGTLVADRAADLLVVDGNPLANLENLGRIRLAMRRGWMIPV
ncbi:MAG: amidohydrolase family protein [Desulfosarcinaceae bacterium]|nr:amidohydrolase family protein [Desulfosarcinaceae bacterium]